MKRHRLDPADTRTSRPREIDRRCRCVRTSAVLMLCRTVLCRHVLATKRVFCNRKQRPILACNGRWSPHAVQMCFCTGCDAIHLTFVSCRVWVINSVSSIPLAQRCVMLSVQILDCAVAGTTLVLLRLYAINDGANAPWKK